MRRRRRAFRRPARPTPTTAARSPPIRPIPATVASATPRVRGGGYHNAPPRDRSRDMRLSSSSALLTVLIAGAAAAENPALTIYRADNDTLFENGGSPVADG